MRGLDEPLRRALGRINDWLGELIDSLSEAEQAALRAQLDGMDAGAMAAWTNTHSEDISRFLCSTPGQLRKDKRLLALQPLLTWGAIQRLFEARPLLLELDRSGLFNPGHDAASFADAAGKHYGDFMAMDKGLIEGLRWIDPRHRLWSWDEPAPRFGHP